MSGFRFNSLAAACSLLVITSVLSLSPASVRAQAADNASGPGSISGLWTTVGYKGSRNNSPRERVLKTLAGEWPPLKPEAEDLLEQRIAMAEEGRPFRSSLSQCLPGGVPQTSLGTPYPMQILETPGQVTMLIEMFNHYRVIYLDATHPEYIDPSYMGHSVGHWDGDTLVVDTVGLTEGTTIDEVGMPHSENLHVIERYRRVDTDSLEVLITIDDPEVFTSTWETRAEFAAAPADMTLLEFICEPENQLAE